jgi:hypothetical protein
MEGENILINNPIALDLSSLANVQTTNSNPNHAIGSQTATEHSGNQNTDLSHEPHEHPQDSRTHRQVPAVNQVGRYSNPLSTPGVLMTGSKHNSMISDRAISMLDINKFFLQRLAPDKWRITAMMTSHIGTEMSGKKLKFTVKKIYMAVQMDGAATFGKISVDRKSNTSTVTRYLKLDDVQIIKLAGVRQSEPDDLDSILYLYTNNKLHKTFVGLFILNQIKYKPLISFNTDPHVFKMAKFFRVSQEQGILSSGLNAHVIVVIFMVRSDSAIDWYRSIASRCCQITTEPQKSSYNEEHADQSLNNTIEGFVTEMIFAVGNKHCALSIVVTKDRHIHLYQIELIAEEKQLRTDSSLIGVYNIDALSTALSSQISGLDFDALVLVDLFFLQSLNNKLILVYTLVSETSVDIIFLQFQVLLENQEREKEYIQAKHHLEQQNAFKKNRTEHEAQSTCKVDSVLKPLSSHRLCINDRDRLGPDWMNTKVLVSEVKVVGKKICMMISSTSLKIQELVILEDDKFTHFSIIDETNQGITSIDSLRVWQSATDSSLSILTQSITENQTAIRDLSFDIKLNSSSPLENP